MAIYVNQTFKVSKEINSKEDDTIIENIFNDVIEIRIIHIQRGEVYYIDLGKTMSVPSSVSMIDMECLLEDGLLKESNDPYPGIASNDGMPEHKLVVIEGLYSIIKDVWDDPDKREEILKKRYRNKLYQQIAKDHNISFSLVKRMFYRFWQRGMNQYSLVDSYSKCGNPGAERINNPNRKKSGRKRKAIFGIPVDNGVAVTPKDRMIFRQMTAKYYNQEEKKTLRDVFSIMKFEKYSRNIYNSKGEIIGEEQLADNETPSYRQWVYWHHKDRDVVKEKKKREGNIAYQKDLRPLHGQAIDGIVGPGSRFEIDSTVADIYLISHITGMVFGRPVIYAIKDVFTDMFVGIHVGVNSASWQELSSCLLNMAEDKVAYCKKYEIDITEEMWPSHHLPSVLFCDRGSEYTSEKSNNFTRYTGIDIKNAPSYRPDLKGMVEQGFTIFNDPAKRFMPGDVQKPLRTRGVKRPELDAAITLHDFTYIIICMVLEHNNNPVRRQGGAKDVNKVPSSEWADGIKSSSGSLRIINNMDLYKLALMSTGSAEASIARRGLIMDRLLYNLNYPEIYLKTGSKKIKVVYDGRDMSQIYIPNDKWTDYEICTLRGIKYQGLSYEEILFEFDTINNNNRLLSQQHSNSKSILSQIMLDMTKHAQEKKLKYISPPTKSAIFNGKIQNKMQMRQLTNRENAIRVNADVVEVSFEQKNETSGVKQLMLKAENRALREARKGSDMDE
jgi:hypothetical protein